MPDAGSRTTRCEALEREIHDVGAERMAAFFCEPVIGAGGVRPPPPGYIEGVADLCAEHGVLLIVDAVIFGFGRLGTWFGIERWDVRPDIIMFAKGVTSGELPLGGVVVSGRVAEPFWEGRAAPSSATGPRTRAIPSAPPRRSRTSTSWSARGCSSAAASSRATSPPCSARSLRARRGGGARGPRPAGRRRAAPDVLAADPAAVAKIAAAARERGVLVRPLGSGVAVSPPLTVQDEHLQLIGEALDGAFGDAPQRIAAMRA